ncbi:unnamed protein product [Sordaria macrospora k-hell]|uniref:WGS project CABT00000000 data, contig 2.2 n=1 Tax=Sordaria macrospora (strain ATCC MYA-333 / DSM 997 / K(L3346) / K-hell) TaxID=771870 RepID=F7VNF1_SORMK|nr:uncharacterized protein SMAC_00906 [Sordaria macrospora k-hell]CCC06880.1 unnamed protein product [Sordaria macrospora k-hell]
MDYGKQDPPPYNQPQPPRLPTPATALPRRRAVLPTASPKAAIILLRIPTTRLQANTDNSQDRTSRGHRWATISNSNLHRERIISRDPRRKGTTSSRKSGRATLM